MKVTEELQIIIDEAEVSAIGESTDENKRVLEACKKVQNWLDSFPELLDSISELHSESLEKTKINKI
jgi:hypothetical protein